MTMLVRSHWFRLDMTFKRMTWGGTETKSFIRFSKKINCDDVARRVCVSDSNPSWPKMAKNQSAPGLCERSRPESVVERIGQRWRSWDPVGQRRGRPIEHHGRFKRRRGALQERRDWTLLLRSRRAKLLLLWYVLRPAWRLQLRALPTIGEGETVL